ncbi:hypothetical protein DEIPH_ctg017orf0221 [Deinococcus phoenicis]|uniref:Uncharacterized protein n=1 Tax=Deinococcus phoenicis TaxID=1476583 RepID=A0A016QS01_9DEIO|nr:hypothetical protein DEIPH_ctg017orf0221 [Deinococcus phoenicis]
MMLAEIAEALAELLPERVFAVGYSTCRVWLSDRTEYVLFDEPETLRPLEFALREEIEARGLHWHLQPAPHGLTRYTARVSDWDRVRWDGRADTPAAALALALLGFLDLQCAPASSPPTPIDVPTPYPLGSQVSWNEGLSSRPRIGTVEAVHQQPGWPAEYDVRVLRQDGTPGAQVQRRHHSELTPKGS